METVSFHVDVNARQRDYEVLPNGHLLVTKIFRTIQGEGPFTGRVAVFIRLSGCNLGAKESCPFCDSDFRFGNGIDMDVASILNNVGGLIPDDHDNLVVVTGGEPLLQPNFPLLLNALVKRYTVQIETNGYFWSDQLTVLKTAYGNYFNVVVSPKVNQRGIYPGLSYGVDTSMDCLKILLDSDPESPYHAPPPYMDGILLRDIDVYVSPIAHYAEAPNPNSKVASIWPGSALDLDRTRRNYVYARDFVLVHPKTRLSLQTHLFIAIE